MEEKETGVVRLIAVPAAIALAITLARLIGELAGGPAALFSRAAGGGGALVGIAWLAPVFGGYFAFRLVRAGRAPASAGRVMGLVALALVAALSLVVGVVTATGNPNVPGGLSRAGAFGQQIGFAAATVVALRLAWPSWPLMLVAMSAGWGTQYELGPPGYPEMGFLGKFVATALFPQLTFWVAYTVLSGGLVGGLVAALARSPGAAGTAATAA